MARIFVVEDDFHAELMGKFSSKEEARELLERLRANPSALENRAPCTSWKTCSRQYYLLEYEDSQTPWAKLSSEPAFEVRQGQVRPILSTT